MAVQTRTIPVLDPQKVDGFTAKLEPRMPAGRSEGVAVDALALNRTLLALCEAILPPVDPSWNVAARTTHEVMLSGARMTPLAWFGLRLGLRLMEWLPLASLKSPRSLSSLPVATRKEIFEQIQSSSSYFVRQAAIALRAAIYFAFYDLPEVRMQVGYRVEGFTVEMCSRRRALLKADEAARQAAPQTVSMILGGTK